MSEMMAPVLPPELLAHICCFIDSKKTLARLALCSSRMYDLAVPLIYADLTVQIYPYPIPTDLYDSAIECIPDISTLRDRLKHYIKNVTIQRCLPETWSDAGWPNTWSNRGFALKYCTDVIHDAFLLPAVEQVRLHSIERSLPVKHNALDTVQSKASVAKHLVLQDCKLHAVDMYHIIRVVDRLESLELNLSRKKWIYSSVEAAMLRSLPRHKDSLREIKVNFATRYSDDYYNNTFESYGFDRSPGNFHNFTCLTSMRIPAAYILDWDSVREDMLIERLPPSVEVLELHFAEHLANSICANLEYLLSHMASLPRLSKIMLEVPANMLGEIIDRGPIDSVVRLGRERGISMILLEKGM